jgi:predicted dehydrogenase
MKQIFQNLRNGRTEVMDVPVPASRRGHLTIRTALSLVSPGTERMLVEFGQAGWLGKARQQPDKLRQAFDKLKTEGLVPTLTAVRDKLDQPLPMGYSNVGVVVAAGEGARGYEIGDRVVSNGHHAEFVCVPVNLCARIPESVADETAAFAVLGAIALQGIRLAQPMIGETFAVFGLGVIGQLLVQLLQANGCRAFAIDPDLHRAELAARFGAATVVCPDREDVLEAAAQHTRGRGIDGALIATSTRSSLPLVQAARACRKRGRIVLVGVSGLEVSRADLYEKELSLQVSCSYGPGRYDPRYERDGQDYPFGLVRWTAQRNFEAVLDLMADGRINPAPLITRRVSIERATDVYESLVTSSADLGILIDYLNPERAAPAARTAAPARASALLARAPVAGVPAVGFIGAGAHARRVLAPGFRRAGASLVAVASLGGASAAHLARKFGFREKTSDPQQVIAHPHIDVVVIATRHDSHADLVCAALNAGKHVFCEKPLALDAGQLERVEAAYAASRSRGAAAPVLMVGYNRRFAPQIATARRLLDAVAAPKALVMTVNAGAIAPDHWIQDPAVGGGRAIGEACHFLDLLGFLAGAGVAELSVQAAANASDAPSDTFSCTLRFHNGSLGALHYFANGHRAVPKERLEAFAGGRILRLDNFRILRGHGWSGFRRQRLWRQDKGQNACIAHFMDAVRGAGPPPIPFEELLAVSRLTFRVAEQLRA